MSGSWYWHQEDMAIYQPPSKAMSDGFRLSPDLWSQEGSGTPGISEPGKSGSLKREGKVARTMEKPNSKQEGEE